MTKVGIKHHVKFKEVFNLWCFFNSHGPEVCSILSFVAYLRTNWWCLENIGKMCSFDIGGGIPPVLMFAANSCKKTKIGIRLKVSLGKKYDWAK